MILKRFQKPKWQHAKPEARKQAIRALTDPATLREIACSDGEPAVRRLACKKIFDLRTLEAIAGDDTDAGVREIAAARQRNLLLGKEPDGPPLQQRLEYLSSSVALHLLDAVALHGKEPELRRTALEQVQNPQVLAEIAIKDGSARIRQQAVERLDDKNALEQVLRRIGRKDKHVYRVARTKLRGIAAQEVEPARIRAQGAALCERVERLGRGHGWVQDKAVLEHLHKQWQALEAQVPVALEQRYRKARGSFLSAYQLYRVENLARIQEEEARAEQADRKRELLDELRSALASDKESVMREALERIPTRWNGLEGDPVPDAGRARMEKDFSVSMDRLRERLEQFQQRHALEDRVQALTREAAALCAGSSPLDARRLAGLHRERRQVMERIGSATVAEALGKHLASLDARLHKQRDRAVEKQERLAGLVRELEQALDEGGLKPATSLYQKIEADLQLIEISGIACKDLDAVRGQLHAILPRLRELQHWRKWGTDQHREALCQSMESLLESELSAEQLAHRLHELQNEWKRLDKSGSPGNRRLWARFHSAADRVFERCGPYFEEQKRQRELARNQREALCTELEGFLQGVDWEHIDWKKTVRAEREMRETWRGLPLVEHGVRRELDKRFRRAMQGLNRHLHDERKRNQEHKRQLIAAARALQDEPDLDKAIGEVKRLQGRWHTTVAGKRKQENRIWGEFRDACDQVFARLHGQQQAHRETLQKNLDVRRRVCAELEALVQSGAQSAGELQQGFAQLQTRWLDSRDLELPRGAEKELEQRWNGAVAQYRQCLEEIRQGRNREQLEQLRRRAALCQELEQYLDRAQDAERILEQVQARWQQLPPLEDAALHAGVEQRYHRVCAALEKGGLLLEEQLRNLPRNQGERESLCLRVEILTGRESPPEAAQQRLAVQVDRLCEHLTQGEADGHDLLTRLEQEWYLLGSAPRGTSEGLEARFQAALRARRQTGGDGNAAARENTA